MYRVIVTLQSSSRRVAEQVAITIRNMYQQVGLGMTVTVEEVEE